MRTSISFAGTLWRSWALLEAKLPMTEEQTELWAATVFSAFGGFRFSGSRTVAQWMLVSFEELTI